MNEYDNILSSISDTPDILTLFKRFRIDGLSDNIYNGVTCEYDKENLYSLINTPISLKRPKNAYSLFLNDNITILGLICILSKDYYDDNDFKKYVESRLIKEGWTKIVDYNHYRFRIFDNEGKLYEFRWKVRHR